MRKQGLHCFKFDGLVKKLVGAKAMSQAPIRLRGMVAENVNLNARGAMLERAQDVESIALGQPDIQYHGVGVRLEYVADGCIYGGGRACATSAINRREHFFETLAYGLRCFDDVNRQRRLWLDSGLGRMSHAASIDAPACASHRRRIIMTLGSRAKRLRKDGNRD